MADYKSVAQDGATVEHRDGCDPNGTERAATAKTDAVPAHPYREPGPTNKKSRGAAMGCCY
jgi:hypothetical protein